METYHLGLVIIAGAAALAPVLVELPFATRTPQSAPDERLDKRLAASWPD